MERAHFLPPSDFGVGRFASQVAVVIFSKTSCCMCRPIKTVFSEVMVHPAVHELDQDPKGKEMERVLRTLGCKQAAVPVVFIGGALIGGTNDVMSLHLIGSLVSLLRRARAP